MGGPSVGWLQGAGRDGGGTDIDRNVGDHLLMVRQVDLWAAGSEGRVWSQYIPLLECKDASERPGVGSSGEGGGAHSSDALETISAPRTSTRSCVPAGDGSCESCMVAGGSERDEMGALSCYGRSPGLDRWS